MHPFIYTHGLIIVMHTPHVKKSHSDCSQSLIKNHPNRLLCCLLLLHHVFVCFVYYFMQCTTLRSLSLHSNSPFPLSRKSAVICRRSARNYRNSHILPKSACCPLSGVILIILMQFMCILFFRIHRWVESWKEQHLFEIEIFYNILDEWKHESLDVSG